MKSRKAKIENRIYWCVLIPLVVLTCITIHIASEYQIRVLATSDFKFQEQQLAAYQTLGMLNWLIGIATLVWTVGGYYIIGTWNLQFPTRLYDIDWHAKLKDEEELTIKPRVIGYVAVAGNF